MSKHDHLIEASEILQKRFDDIRNRHIHEIPPPQEHLIDTQILAQALSLTIRALRDHITEHDH